MILMNAIVNLSTKQRSASNRLSAAITLNNQSIAGEQQPTFEFFRCYLKEARVVRKNSIPLNMRHS